jgi:hypothetical protein
LRDIAGTKVQGVQGVQGVQEVQEVVEGEVVVGVEVVEVGVGFGRGGVV